MQNTNQPSDRSTDPGAYGPQGPELTRQPATDVVEPMRQALSDISPEESYVIDSVGKAVGKSTSAGLLLKHAMQTGETTESIRKTIEAADASEMALELAEVSIAQGIDDDEFERLLAQMGQEGQNMPGIPQRGQQKMPGHLEQGLAALLSLGTPEHAFSIGAVPYQNEARKVEEQYQHDVQAYGQEMAKRSERINMLEMRMKFAHQKRQETAETVRRLADEAYKRGETKKAHGLTLRGQLYDAENATELDDRIKTMREQGYAEFVPDAKTISGLKLQFTNAQKTLEDKAKLDADKAEISRIDKGVDDYRASVALYTQGAHITPAMVAQLEKDRQTFAKENNIPLHRLPKPMERTIASNDLAERKFKQEGDRYDDNQWARDAERIEKQLDIDWKRERLAKEIAGVGAKDPAKIAKRKKISSLDTKVETARLELDKHLHQELPTDPEERAKYDKRIRDLVTDEYTIVAAKRKLLGGKVPTFGEYLKEQYPAAVAGFGPIQPGEINPDPKVATKAAIKKPSGFGAPK